MAASFGFLKQSAKSGLNRTFSLCTSRFQHLLSSKESPSSFNKDNVSVVDREVKYPAIKPKYPTGSWGKMDSKYAWLWNDAKENHLCIPNVQERIDALVEKEMSAIVLDPFNEHPSALPFRQYVTKTEMMNWEDGIPLYKDSFSDLEASQAVIDQLKQDISDFLLIEYELLERSGSPSEKSVLCQSLIRLISSSLITRLGKQFSHLKTCQFDENVIVRSLWDRHGIERKRRKYTSDSDVLIFNTVQDQRITSEGNFQAMLRSHLPLPEVISRDDGISVSSNPPQLKFKPSAYGHEKSQKKKVDGIVAGHRLGDPCEFGLVGFLSTCDSHSVEERISSQTAKDCRLAQGLTMSFSWLAAQAANQGFSHLVDLTYPLTSQTVLTDGRVFSFLAYQLNTLELWKDDEANPCVNLCWHSKEMPLYHSVENGKVNELNEDVLRTLVKMFTLEPKDRGYNMKPTISAPFEDLSDKQDFVPVRVIKEEVVKEEQYIVS